MNLRQSIESPEYMGIIWMKIHIRSNSAGIDSIQVSFFVLALRIIEIPRCDSTSKQLSISNEDDKSHKNHNSNNQDSNKCVFETHFRNPWCQREYESCAESVASQSDSYQCVSNYLYWRQNKSSYNRHHFETYILIRVGQVCYR